ncbi:Glycine-rich domain-containing protein 1, partial [Cucurbita argyrosperma subsp. sororia]
MEKNQELEWAEAQRIEIGVDLVATAKRQLQFLSAVDRNRFLYEGPSLERAIYRYNAYWLPLLAKHSESPLFEGPLAVPFDCEWIWHCHRLNPVRYKSDCEELYGKILDNSNVVSTLGSSCLRETEEVWNELYPEEPFNFNFNPTGEYQEDALKVLSGLEKYTKYDLVSAVKRQSPFFYQVSRPHMDNEVFLQEAVARYKGFLYLIKSNREKSIKRFCVPTYDIDLIWHSHQLNPISYCKDLKNLIGMVLEHDDMDSDRTKGKKLDTGFSGTTKQWEDTFGTRYWKAGAMYRGNSPSPLLLNSYSGSSNLIRDDMVSSQECQNIVHLPELKTVEVLLEFVEVKNKPEGLKGNFFVQFMKSQPDAIFSAKRKLSILSETGVKQVASFQCEPKGDLQFELICNRSSSIPITRTSLTLGSISLPLHDILVPTSKLSMERWLELKPVSDHVSSKPISLRVAISFTVPHPAPRELHMFFSRELSRWTSFLPSCTKMQHSKGWMQVTDEAGNEVISLQLRDSLKEKVGKNSIPTSKEVIGIKMSGESSLLAEFVKTGWSLIDGQWFLDFQKKSNEDDHLFKLVGKRLVKFFQGSKLDYEPKNCGKHNHDSDFVTAIEFSAEYPYGRAVALFDLKFGVIKIKEEWMVVPGIMTAFLLLHARKKKGYNGLTVSEEKLEVAPVPESVHTSGKEENNMNLINVSLSSTDLKVNVSEGVSKENVTIPLKEDELSSHCGRCDAGGYTAGSGNMVKSGGCGGCGAGGCGGGCGNMVKSGGCGGCGAGGCGGGCGNMVKSGGCGGCGAGGCGGGCGNIINSGGCGGCGAGGCGGGCGNIVNSGGCGGCGAGGCGGGCGNIVNSGSSVGGIVAKSGGCGGCGGGCGGCGGGCGGFGHKTAQPNEGNNQSDAITA